LTIPGLTLDYLLNGKDKDIIAARQRELQLRKDAGKMVKMLDKIQKQLMKMRPLVG